jgi:hypothetical protein
MTPAGTAIEVSSRHHWPCLKQALHPLPDSRNACTVGPSQGLSSMGAIAQLFLYSENRNPAQHSAMHETKLDLSPQQFLMQHSVLSNRLHGTTQYKGRWVWRPGYGGVVIPNTGYDPVIHADGCQRGLSHGYCTHETRCGASSRPGHLYQMQRWGCFSIVSGRVSALHSLV